MTTVRGGESHLTSDETDSQLEQRSSGRSDLESQNLDDELADILEGADEQPRQMSAQPHPAAPSAKPAKSETVVNRILNSKSMAIARKLGYGLLIVSIIDFIFILIPPQFLNPVWEYKVIGDMIKLVPLPLLAFLLIFVGEQQNRKPIERLPLKILSWITLVISIFFFLLLPLIVTDYVRINRYNVAQISSEVNLQKRKLNATQEQLAQMDAQQIQDLIPRRSEDGSVGAIPDTPELAKESIVENIEQAKSQADARAKTARENVTLNLVKNSVKLSLQAFLAGVLYALLWVSTKWARKSKSKRKRRAA